MYYCSEEVRELFKKRYRQVARVYKRTSNGDTLIATEENIISNGLNIERYAFPSGEPKINGTMTARLSLSLDNRDDEFAHVTFTGLSLYVEIGTKNWDDEDSEIAWIPCGVYKVQGIVSNRKIINITALDYMCKLDRLSILKSSDFPMSGAALLDKCCQDADVTKGYYNRWHNFALSVNGLLDYGNVTNRKILQDCCLLEGYNTYFDYNGVLQFTQNRVSYNSITSSLPFDFPGNGYPLADYIIYGASGGVGDKTANMFIPNTWRQGYCANVNGQYTYDTNWVCTPLIECQGGNTYSFSFDNKSRSYSFVWYDDNKNYISYNSLVRLSQPVSFTATAPNNAKYLVVNVAGPVNRPNSIIPSDMINFMLNEGDSPLPYEPYGYKIPITVSGENVFPDTITIYLDEPLYENDTLSFEDSNVSITTHVGVNTLQALTTIRPSQMYIRIDKPVLTANDRYSTEVEGISYDIGGLKYTFKDGQHIWTTEEDEEGMESGSYSLRSSDNVILESWYAEGSGTPAERLPEYFDINLTQHFQSLQSFCINAKPMPYIFPFDEIVLENVEGKNYVVVVTNVSIGLNRNTVVSCSISPEHDVYRETYFN